MSVVSINMVYKTEITEGAESDNNNSELFTDIRSLKVKQTANITLAC